jgi:3-phenylpropionate/cinnamic acid dioxygenase small subunit
MAVPLALRYEIEELLAEYAAVLDAADLEQWPEFFTEQCFYEIIPRENYDRGLPLAIMRCESKGMLKDRVVAIRDTMMYEPRYLRHMISAIRITGESPAGITVEANYAVFETPMDDLTRVFNVGRYLDRIVRDKGQLKFAEKHCVYDSVLVPNSLIYPL